MTMNRGSMAKQITEAPMASCKSKRMKSGGSVKTGYKKGGSVKGYRKGGSVDQTQCSPRKRMAMGGGNG
jgi:hypothetical protein